MGKSIGLALEGGGARGAYQAGAIKLLIERGYEFECVCGTSIGAINAAMVVQGRGKDLCDIWQNISYSQIFEIDENKLRRLLNKQINRNVLKYMSGFLVNTVKEKGLNTVKMKEFLNKYISEEKLRKAKCEFGIVTVCMSNLRGYELYKEDIGEGKLIDYILASGRLPGFKQELLDGKYYMDGGMHNNCPINMVERKGVKDIIAIRLGSNLATKDEKKLVKRKDLNITFIEPNFELPSILSFDAQVSRYLINLGYYDAIKKLDNLEGVKYYIEPFDEKEAFDMITSIDNDNLNSIYSMFKLKKVENSYKVYLEVVLPMVLKKIGKDNLSTYKELIISISEYTAEYLKIREFMVRDIKTFLLEIKEKLNKIPITSSKLSKADKVIFSIIKYIKVE